MRDLDVIVVGGGVMGCGIALRLRQAGARVTVLERAIPGAEASSAAGGILAPQEESEGPGPFLDLCLASRALYPEFAAELRALTGIDVHYLPSGVMHLAFDDAGLQRLEATAAWQRARGLRVELLSGAEVRALEPQLTSDVRGATRFVEDHQVDNRLLTRALTMAAAKVGATFRTGYVRGVVEERGRVVGVDLEGEVLRAQAVVIAAGSWSGLVQGSALDPRVVRPARGQMVQFQARLPPFTHVVFSDQGYLIPRQDGRVLAGSTLEFAGFEKSVTAEGLHRILTLALRMCPALARVPVQETWAGLRPYTDDHLPILGAGPLPGLFLATGHFRNGILLTPITAKLLAEEVLGERTSVDLTPFRFDRFPRR
jgi:glycine oxidase